MKIGSYPICCISVTAIAVSLLSLCTLGGCATTADPEPAISAPTMEPWTPTRKGLHPGDLQHSTAAAGVRHQHNQGPGATELSGGPVGITAHLFWHLYTRTLSRQMGETCRFSPSCSRFAVDAVGVGPMGFPLAFARLQRSHLDDGSYEKTSEGHLIDPISHYFFWRSELGIDAHRSSMSSGYAWYVLIRATDALPENFFDD